MGELRISDKEIEQVLTTGDFVASCHEAFRLYGSGEMVNPARKEEVLREGGQEVFRLVLPGEWKDRYRGRKVIEERSDVATGRLGDRKAFIELTELATGRRAVLDAGVITDMRTGAAGALGARYLGPELARSAAVLGTGRVSRALTLCLDEAVRPDEICVTSRKPENRAAFERDVGPRVRAALRMCDSVERCVAGAEVVLTAVPTVRPILRQQDLEARTLVCVIAGDPRTNQLEMDLMCSRPVVVDHVGQAERSGDFVAAASADRLADIRLVKGQGGRVMTIGDAALGRLADLKGAGAICYFTGMAIQDIHAAATVLERLQARG